MKIFKESNFTFSFSNRWNVIKFDSHRFYRTLSGHNFSGLDFTAIDELDEHAYLIEVKNYKQYESDTEPKGEEAFVRDIYEKIKDSLDLIGLIYKYYRSKIWYRTFYPLVRKFNFINREWVFWTRLYELTRGDKQATFILLIDADYDKLSISKSLAPAGIEFGIDISVEQLEPKELMPGFSLLR